LTGAKKKSAALFLSSHKLVGSSTLFDVDRDRALRVALDSIESFTSLDGAVCGGIVHRVFLNG
jgi:hypothetical protein